MKPNDVYRHLMIHYMKPRDVEFFDRMEDEKGRRDLVKEFLMDNLEAFVWIMGYRDLGEFHKREIRELERFQFVKDEPVRIREDACSALIYAVSGLDEAPKVEKPKVVGMTADRYEEMERKQYEYYGVV